MAKPRLTADKAREIAGRTFDEKIDAILEKIEEVSKDHKRCLRTGWQYRDDKSLWIDGGYSGTDEWKQAKKTLEDLGYKVSFFYKEAQFVDMYTLIEW